VKQTKPLKVKTPLKAKSSLKAKTALKSKPAGKKQPKPTITKLKKKADTVFSKSVRYRFARKIDGEWIGECITCKVRKPIKQLQCGHFMSRQYNATRFDRKNCASQCYGCNVMQQGRQYIFGIELDKLYGEGTANELLEKARTVHKLTHEELERIIWESEQDILFYENGAIW